jgi:hypothetical protein
VGSGSASPSSLVSFLPEVKAMIYSAFKVLEDSFSSLHMFIGWTMKKLAQLVDNVGYVKSYECAIL